MDHAETDLSPRYERGTLRRSTVIGKDIKRASPDRRHGLFGSGYHFKAACCFARATTCSCRTGAMPSNTRRCPDLQPVVAAARYSAIAALPRTSRHQEYVNSPARPTSPPGRDIEQRTAFRLLLHRRPLFAAAARNL
ncbi:MAG: hypothetical protein ACLRMJ_11325 [Alistipes finegoldii]